VAKTDQPGLFEKHAEKIAVAAAAVVLIVVLALWVVKSPNVTDKIGRSVEPAQPSEMDSRLASAAQQAARIIEDRDPSIERLPNSVGGLNARISRPLGRGPSTFINFTEGETAREMAEGPVGGKQVSEMPPIPPLAEPKVWIGHELVQRSARAGMGMGSPSEDVTVAHVTAVLNYGRMVEAWKDALNGTGTPMDVRFVRVVAERRERLADGSWSDVEQVGSFRPDMGSGAAVPEVPTFDRTNLMAVKQAVEMLGASGVQNLVIQPTYYPVYWPEARTFAGWMHHLPRTRVSTLETAIILPGQQQPAPYAADSTFTMASTAGTGRGADAGAAGPAGGMGMGMGMGGMGMGGMGGMGAAYGGSSAYGGGTGGRTGGTTPRQPRDTGNQVREAATRAVDNAITALNDGESLLAQGKLREAESKFRAAERLLRQAESNAPNLQSIGPELQRAKNLLARLDMPQVTPVPLLAHMCQEGWVQLWLHDNSCRPGATYRYRLRLDVYNPLFVSVTPTTKPEKIPPLVLPTVSDWTSAVTVPNRTEFYITGADSKGQVKVAVFRQTFGQVLMQKAVAAVGDTIGTVESRLYIDPVTNRPAMENTDVPFDTGYVIVDLDPSKRIAPKGLNSSTVQVTLLAPDGALSTRILADDRRDPRYRELTKASKEAEQQLQQTPTPGAY